VSAANFRSVSGSTVCCEFVSLSVTISRCFTWIDWPPARPVWCFFPFTDFVVLAGDPHKEGVFLGLFPFSRFGSVQHIRDRFSVELTCGETGAVILRTIKVEELRVNPDYARGCFVAKITEVDFDTGRRVVPPFERPELWRRRR